VISADGWPDDLRLSDLEPRFTCKACGHRGGDVRPCFDDPRVLGRQMRGAGRISITGILK